MDATMTTTLRPTPKSLPPPLTLNPLLYYIFYASIALSRLTGVINFAYDYRRRRFVLHSRWSKIYSGLLHATHCVLLPLCLTSPALRDVAYQRRAFYVALNSFISALRLPALLVTLLGTWLQRKQLFDIINAFERLRHMHFHTLAAEEWQQILRNNDRCLLVKLATSAVQCMTFCVRVFIFNRQPSGEFIALFVYFAFLEMLTIFLVNHFYLGMLYANCAFRYVHAELRIFVAGVEDVAQQLRHAAEALDRIARIHTQICALTASLRRIYEVQIVAILLSIFAANISLFFSLIVWFNDSKAEVNYVLLLFLLYIALINVIDLWLLTFVCSDTIRMSQQPVDVLRDLTGHRRLDVRLKRSVEQMSLTLKLHPLRLPMCGLFNLSTETAYLLTKATAMYLIILVQFDYKNL